MNIRIETTSGVAIEAPEQKWLVALLVTLADRDPALFAAVCYKVDNRIDAYATIPASVQRSLTGD